MSIEKSFNELVAVLPDKANLSRAETHSFKYACINLIKDELSRKNKLTVIEKIMQKRKKRNVGFICFGN